MTRFTLAAILFLPLTASGSGPVLFVERGPVESLDLAGGPGGRERAPRPPFTFVKEELGGTSAKVVARDAAGSTWTAKFGEEVKAENFAARIAWAAGYHADITYFVGSGRIEGVKDLGRASTFIDSSGQFRGARFELRDAAAAKLIPESKWSLDQPSLKGTRELAGLKALFVLLSNWDVKPENMAVVEVNGQQFYAVTDWGATMGRAGDFTGRAKWDCKQYTADTPNLVQDVDNGFVTLRYDGKQRHEVLREVKVEDVKWLMQRMGRLTDAQVSAALTASGATPQEVACFAKAFRSRLQQLAKVKDAGTDEVITHTRREVRTIRKQTK